MNKKNYCRLYIVRHGQTEWNVKGLLQGHKDIPLNQEGKKQANQLGNILKKVKFAKAFSSDLLRAKETAEIIVLKKKIAVATTKALRERFFGKFEGEKWSQNKKYQKLLNDFQKMSEEEQFKKRPHGDIESNEEMINRLIPFLREVSVAYPGKNILIATHGGIIRTFMIHLGWATDKNLPAGSIENTAYAKIDCDGIDFIVKETSGFAKKPLG